MARLVKQPCNPRPGHHKKLQNVRANPQSEDINARKKKVKAWKEGKKMRKKIAIENAKKKSEFNVCIPHVPCPPAIRSSAPTVASPQFDDSSTRSINKKENKTLVSKSSSKKSCLKSSQKDVNKYMTTNKGNITGMENGDKKRRSSRKRVTFSDELPKNYRRSVSKKESTTEDFRSSVDHMWAFIKRLQKHGLD